jgi:hypothetical protein
MSQDKPLALCLTARSKKLQEKPLDVQFNSQDVFGYMLPPKECWFKYMKFSKSENQEETDHPKPMNHGQSMSTTGHVLLLRDD